MSSKDGRLAVVFNGEIYNFISLRNSLMLKGHVFNSHSDTEVLVASFVEWGIEETLQKLVGMFAIAVFDKLTDELHLIRDRMGEKPLYYGYFNGVFAFASELKAITLHPRFNGARDNTSLSEFLKYGYVPTPHTPYKNVKKLGTACHLVIDTQKIANNPDGIKLESLEPHRYWNLDSVFESRPGQQRKAREISYYANELEDMMSGIIQDQLVADVPVGAFLSGGIDSTTVVAVAQSISQNPIKTFTIGFATEAFNEAEHAKKVADLLKTEHHEHYVTEDDALDLIPKLPNIFDEPFADASNIPMTLVSQFASKHVTVCLSGDGGDELFCGYNRYSYGAKINQLKLPKFLANSLSNIIKTLPPQLLDKFYQGINSALFSGAKPQASFGKKIHKLADCLAIEDSHALYDYLISFNHEANLQPYGSRTPSWHGPTRVDQSNFHHYAMYTDQRMYLPDDNLTKGDRCSMASSLEMRLPLLDHRLVEYSWQIPFSAKLDPQIGTKSILREILYKHVPKAYVERPKMGFSVPISEWIRGPLLPWAEDLITNEIDAIKELIDPNTVFTLWAKHKSGKNDYPLELWSILMLLLWNRSYSQ